MSTIAFVSLRRCCAALLIGATALLAGCATHVVDGALKEVPATAFARPAKPAPVQLVTEFQTKGVVNARATDYIKKTVSDAVSASGLFDQVSDKPAPQAGMLSVTLNNVPLTEDIFGKGFMAGLTFGAAGQTVTDGYLCTVSYLPAGVASPIVKTVRHAIHTNLGATAAPNNAYKAASLEEAVQTMVRQAVRSALNDLSHDPAFR
jgi:hypothetical protein